MNEKLIHTLKNSGIEALIDTLLSESFAEKHHFQAMNLEAIGQLLEEQKDQFENPDALSNEFIQELESFEKCKSTYCLILMELELHSFESLPTETLGEIKSGSNQAPVNLFDPEDDSMSEKTMIRMGISGKLVKNEVQRPQKPSVEKLDEDLPVLEPITSSMPTLDPEPSVSNFNSFQASQYAHSADKFRAMRETGESESSHEISIRVESLLKCWALELELAERLEATITEIWAQKDLLFSSVLSRMNGVTALSEQCKTRISQIAGENSSLLLDGKPPTSGVLSSVRYLTQAKNISQLTLAPMDYATLLLLGTPEVAGISKKELERLSLRLCRIQKIKAKISSPKAGFEPELNRLFDEDYEEVLRTLNKFSSGHGHSAMQVA